MMPWIPLDQRPILAYDSETSLWTPGRYVPDLVCGSFYDDEDAALDADQEAEETGGTLLLRDAALQMLKSAITDPQFDQAQGLLAGANIAYDLAVAGQEDPDMLPAIFDLLDRQGVFDVLIGQALDHVAKGHLFKDPDGVSKMVGPTGEIKHRYSLDLVLFQRLGIADAKQNDEFRLRYGQLKEIPFEQWPIKAKTYPVDDARGAYQATKDLIKKAANMSPLVRYIPVKHSSEWTTVNVDWYGGRQGVPLSHPGLNAYAAFCLHLLTAWGLRVDPVHLRELIERSEKKHQEEIDQFVGIGLLKAGCPKHESLPTKYDPDCPVCREDRGKDNGPEIRRAIVRAYNPGRPDIPCQACAGTGKVLSPKTKKPIQCKKCSATGLDIGQAPVTEKEGVSASRDSCLQSGNDDLADLKESNNRKIRSTYIPFLTEGVVQPIHVGANVLVKTARSSFGKGDDIDGDEAPGLLQTFPRNGGVRETMVSLPGWYLCSTDWAALEFYNLGQAQMWTCGYSPILDALRAGKDPHVMLGSKMTGTSYEEFQAGRKKDDKKIKKFFADIRQGSKSGNYGFGGRMGPSKFAFTQRVTRIGDHGSMCRLMHREPERGCGSEKITMWKRRPIKTGPICAACVEVSEELRLGWLDLWQLKDYFAWVDAHDGIQDGHGVMITPGTGYIRGGLNVSEGCNQPFQHQGGYGSKLALCMVSRECYVDRGTALFGCRPTVHAHDEILTGMAAPIAHLAAARQTVLMKAAMSIIVPDLEVPIEPALMRRWYKSAEPVFHDPNCTACHEGFVFFIDDKGEPFRKQCAHCQTNGILWPWEPMPEKSIALAWARAR